jgi:luciferase family oxidoreductase group 1
VSILDLSPVSAGSTGAQALRNSIELGKRADKLGYSRYWLAEHHNIPSVASSSPEIMIGQIAAVTTRIRVGSGGVMLPNHAPLKVAENFRVLEGLFPGRIDLGIGRAPGSDTLTALALRRSTEALGADEFPRLLAELIAFTYGQFPIGHAFGAITAMPQDVELPPIWLLGSSDFSAQLAAAIGVGFAFAHHISPGTAVEAIKLYKDNFEPAERLSAPVAIVATTAVCAETDERARELSSSLALSFLRLRSNRPAPIASPEEALAYPYTPEEWAQLNAYLDRYVIGSPETVKAGLTELVERTNADELMLTTNIYSHADRMRSYELLAEAFELPLLEWEHV